MRFGDLPIGNSFIEYGFLPSTVIIARNSGVYTSDLSSADWIDLTPKVNLYSGFTLFVDNQIIVIAISASGNSIVR